ncbi:MAG: alpha/beta hydrolase [Deltaproteobacteria bacterium]|nr:alpha/beta hydrolase [Deltaproteobacteria bacterium]MBW2499339.1 alpha/beta hydrolase [Deltaproteobacteria bacterium]
MPQKYVRRDGLPLLVRHTGATTLPQDPPRTASGPTIVCLHDAGLQSSVFSQLLDELGGRLDGRGCALAFDLPGHGRSGSLDSLPSIHEMAEAACWIGDWCRTERPLLVGHGMGALVALEWCRTRPDSIAGIVLCGAGLALGIGDDQIEQMRRVSHGKAPRPFDPSRLASGADPELMKRAYMEGIGTDPRATLVDLESCRTWSETIASALAEPACETRIVLGEAEPEDCRDRAMALAAGWTRASQVTIEKAAHFLPIEQPAALASEVLRLAEAA